MTEKLLIQLFSTSNVLEALLFFQLLMLKKKASHEVEKHAIMYRPSEYSHMCRKHVQLLPCEQIQCVSLTLLDVR